MHKERGHLTMKSYAQNFEDVLLWRALKGVENGAYVDLGAQHPVVDSVSRWFYDQGWRGVHVEPVPFYADLLRKDRPDEDVIEAVVSEEAGDQIIYVFPDTGLSTMSLAFAQGHRESLGRDWHECIVSSLTLSDLFERTANRDVHWLKVDVEGHERSVLASWGENPVRPWIVLVEATLPNTQIETHTEWESLLTSRGYAFVYADGLNRYYLHEAHDELRDRFRYPPNYFDHFSLDEHWATADLRDRNQQRVQQSDNLRQEAEAAKEQAILQSEERDARLTAAITDQVNGRIEALVNEISRSHEAAQESEARLMAEITGRIEGLSSEIIRAHEATETRLRGMHFEARKASDADRTANNARLIARIEQVDDVTRSRDQALEQMVVRVDQQIDAIIKYFQFLEQSITEMKSRRWWLLRAIFGPRKEGLLGVGGSFNAAPLWRKTGIYEDVTATPVQGFDSLTKNTFHEAVTLGEIYGLPPADFVKASYRILFDREADSGGLSHYLGRMALGNSRQSIHQSMLRSKEYRIRTSFADLMGLDDEAFVEAAYRRVLCRAADDEGRAHYLKQLRNGKSRRRLLEDLVRSNEARSGAQPVARLRRQIESSLSWRARIRSPRQTQRRLAQLDFALSTAIQRIETDLQQLRSGVERRSQEAARAASLVPAIPRSERPRWVPRDVRAKRRLLASATSQAVVPHPDYIDVAGQLKQEAPFGKLTDALAGQQDIDDYLEAAYEPEDHNGDRVRWIGWEAAAYLRVTGPRFNVQAAGFFEERPVLVSFGEDVIGMLRFGKEQSWANLPVEGWVGKDVAVHLKCAGVINPAAAGINSDQRDLGVLIRSIYFD